MKLNVAAFLVVFFCSTVFVSAQTKKEKLESSFNQLLNDPQVKYAMASFCVLDAQTGEIVYAKNENIGLATASTLKTIVAATAYHILGKDYTYKTTLSYSGSISADGTLNGDIYIQGSGDPSLGSWRYEQTKESVILKNFVAAINAAGIKSIKGRIIGDASKWPTQSTPEGWIWSDIGNYYGASATGLNWRENQFDIKLLPGSKSGDPVKVLKTVPENSYLKIHNELTTGAAGTGDNAYVYLAPYTTEGYMRGTWGIGIAKSAISASIPDPAFEAAFRLQDTLSKLKIIVSESPTTTRILMQEGKKIPANLNLLTSHSSPKLSDLAYWYLNKSINLYGEAFIKTIATEKGKVANTKNGATELIKFWKNKGYDENALNIIDGSGLAPANRVTTLAMAKILFEVQNESWYSDFIKGFPTNNGMKLKSGNISDVQGYAGYHTDTQGKKFVVVINVNNYNGSGISRKIFQALNALK